MKDSRINRKNAVHIYNWCKKQFGRSSINGNYPKFIFHRVKIDVDDSKVLGEYHPWTNIIRIYQTPFEKKNRRFLTFINTIIHEFWHYHQDIKVKYQKINNYQKNPLEIEANRVAKRNQYKCYQELFNKEK